jgi:hypothetical protein
MAADNSVAQKVEAPPLKPLVLKSRLAGTPGLPKCSSKVKNAAGQEVALGDPRATRALIALMDVHAVNGGAACHWGGPAAFAEINAAVHGLMFSIQDRPWHEAFNYVNDAGHAENGVYALRANYGFDGLSPSSPATASRISTPRACSSQTARSVPPSARRRDWRWATRPRVAIGSPC